MSLRPVFTDRGSFIYVDQWPDKSGFFVIINRSFCVFLHKNITCVNLLGVPW